MLLLINEIISAVTEKNLRIINKKIRPIVFAVGLFNLWEIYNLFSLLGFNMPFGNTYPAELYCSSSFSKSLILSLSIDAVI